jgi:hypothetical protein
MKAEDLRQLLSYNPNTGELIWLARDEGWFKKPTDAKGWNKKYAGTKAFQTLHYGYLHGHVFKKHYFAHRIAWAIHYGSWPTGQIDHVSGLRSDNRIENLRDVSHSDNQKNVKLRHDNKCGMPGIDWKKHASAWRVRVSREGKRRLVGYFKNLDEAVTARRDAQQEAAYHVNHGRIAERHVL